MASVEPIIVRDFKSADSMTTDQRRAWFAAQAQAARATDSVTFARFSHHPEDPDWLLFEGWSVQPKRQGPLRFPPVATRA